MGPSASRTDSVLPFRDFSRRRRAAATLAALTLLLPATSGRAEIFSFGNQKLLAFGDFAVNDATPLRVVTSSTGALQFSSGLAFDATRRELYVARSGAVEVFSADASGVTTTLRSIAGGMTGLGDAAAVAVDLVHDLLYVSVVDDDSVRVFHRADTGNVPPLRVLKGATTTIDQPFGLFVDLVHGELVVAMSAAVANGRAVATFALADLTASGPIDVAPIRRIAGAATLLSEPRGVAVDLAGDRLVVADRAGALHAYARTANGNVAPVQEIAGGNTQLGAAQEVEILADGSFLVGTDGSPQSRLVLHAAAASGNANPTRQIAGPTTQLTFSIGVASSHARDCAWAKSVDGCLFRDGFEASSVCDWSTASPIVLCP